MEKSTEKNLNFTKLLTRRAADRPGETAAIDPVAGARLSYGDLIHRAHRLATALRRRGVGTEVRVGVAVERSPEWLVAFAGVLAAGGVYVPIDPDWPVERQRQVEDDADLHLRLERGTVLELEAAGEVEPPPVPPAKPDPRSAAYVIYTSGSTGRPKGVVVEHRSLAWYVATFGARYAIAPGDNVLQFSSPGFDLSVAELALPLAHGATVVLRTPEMGDSLAAFLDACHRLDVHVFLAPTAFWHELAAELGRHPENLPPGLRLVSFGGEPVLGERVRQWMAAAGRRVRLLNAYGPTEATIEATLHEYADAATPSSVGLPVEGMRSRIIDRRGRPLEPGRAGELTLSGRGVARGYSGWPAATARRFVPDPDAGEPGARRYLTGDLARLDDGRLTILGRVDRQVKIRGVRVEPGEIEARLAEHPELGQAAVVAREDQPGHRYLAAFACPLQTRFPPELGEEVRAFLAERLPSAMVPASINLLSALPLTPSGKIDRQALAEDRHHDSQRHPYRPPRTAIERHLAEIWAGVLQLEQVGIHDDIFELGGDSILNLKILAKIGELGWGLSPKDLFRHPTIAELAEVVVMAGAAPQLGDEQETVRGPLPLTPIQHWFFEDLDPPRRWHFNQAVILEVGRTLEPRCLERAVSSLLRHHDALRMRFVRQRGGAGPDTGEWHGEWRQSNAGLEATAAPLVCIDLTCCRRVPLPLIVRRVAGRLQASLDLEHGPLLRAAYFDRGPLPGRLFICIHHLVIDGVSWRIIFDDLETLYRRIEESGGEGGRALLPRKTTSYRTWARRLVEHAAGPAARTEAAYWLAVPRTAAPPAADFPAGENSRQALERVTVQLDAATTTQLLRQVPSAYRTRINDTLLSALLLAFSRLTGERKLLVELEGHGREDLFDGVDLSRTVGWFTAAFPVHLEAPEDADPGEVLGRIKETLRAIPRHGVGYYLLRYLSPDAALRKRLATLRQPEVSFNYLGQMDPLFSPSSLFGPAGESTGERDGRRGRRPFVFEVDGFVAEERLWINFKYSCRMYRRQTVDRLAAGFMDELRRIVKHCLEPRAGGCTASDFPLAGLGAQELQDLVGHDRGVEDLYPLSPTQQGILFHALYAPDSAVYVEQNAWSITGGLDVDAFHQAWERLLERHAILRTAFVFEGLERPLQIVHRHPPLPFERLDWSELPAAEQERRLEELLAADRQRGFDLDVAPLTRCCLIRLGRQHHRFVWSVHHLLLDGWSISLLLDELFEIYHALRHGEAWERPRPRPFRDFIGWLESTGRDAAKSFWKKRLAGFTEPTPLAVERLRPVALPPPPGSGRPDSAAPGFELGHEIFHLGARVSARLADAARRRHSTLAILTQGAWALILARAAGRREVLFGTTSAGRPQTLAGADGMIGLLVATLPVRIEVDENALLSSWIETIQERHLDMMQHQWISLPEIQGCSEIPAPGPLFESLLGFQNFPGGEAGLRERHGELDLGDLRYFSQTDQPLAVEILPGLRLEFHARYDRRRFERTAVGRLLRSLATALEAMAEAPPDSRLGELPGLAPAEIQQALYEWSRGPTAPTAPLFAELFAARVAEDPAATALVWATADGPRRSLSYGELGRRATTLAAALAARLPDPETRIGVYCPRSPERTLGLLAVLLAGGVYVPLDPDHPPARTAAVVKDAEVVLVLTSPELGDPWPDDVERFAFEVAPPESAESKSAPGLPDRRSLAYVIHTSGSTGRPKGVMVEHRQLAALLTADTFALSPGQAVAQCAAPGFDVAILETCAALAAGAALHVVPAAARVGPSLADFLGQRRITHLAITPSALEALPEAAAAELTELSTLMVGGEPCPPDLAARWTSLPDGRTRRFITAYGPTEATICATLGGPPEPEGGPPPLGRPVAGTGILVLDRRLRPVAMGSPGELFLDGAGLARGYAGRPRETAARYLPHPLATRPGRRLYRTGDLARYSNAGGLLFAGRADRQVKVRGMRIEPGEIERALERIPGVERAAVARRGAAAAARLLAWVTVRDDHPAGAAGGSDDNVVHRNEASAQNESGFESESGVESEQVEHWRALYDDVYRRHFPDGRWQDEERSLTVGWISSYTDEPIPAAEMREWLEHTLERVRRLKPRRVLEIGCGTGLLTMALAGEVEHWVGTDFSPVALEVLRSRLTARDLADKVVLQQRAAIDFSTIPADTFDLVILNSVVQYFPSLEYLRAVLRGAARSLAPGGAIFVGDLRDLALHRAFCTSVELHRASGDLLANELERRVEARLRREEELLIDVSFFQDLDVEIPRLGGVIVRPKRGRARNELTAYRYDVTLLLDREPEATDILELDWSADRLDPHDLQRRLQRLTASTTDEGPIRALRVRHVPDARFIDGAARGIGAPEPEDILEAARGLDWIAELAWRDGQPGDRLEALFHRPGAPDPAITPVGQTPGRRTPPKDRPAANRPLAERRRRELVERLRRELTANLPAAMIPAAFVVLDEMPRTAHGKIDFRALPDAEGERPLLKSGFVAPRDPLEASLAEIWAEVLGLNRVGVDDDFFELGGHSLLATRLASRMRAHFALDVSLRAVFEAPTVACLATLLRDLKTDDRPPITPAERAAADPEALPLSFAQQRLWFVDRLRPGDPAFNMDDARRLTGRLDVAALTAALAAIIHRHEILRTTFPSAAGKPRQAIAAATRPGESQPILPLVDLRRLAAPRRREELGRLAKSVALDPFDLARGPLLRARLVRLSGDDTGGESVLLRTLHHIVSDGWSEGVFYHELAQLYIAFAERRCAPLLPLDVQYADYALWQRRFLSGQRLEKELAYWRRQLDDLPLLELPAEPMLTAADPGPRGAVLALELDHPASRRLQGLARDHGASLYMTLLTGFATLLSRLTGQTDLAIGSPIANRQLGETEDLIGFFVNTLVVRVDLDGRPSFAELLARVRETALGAYAHQDLPFERLVEELRPQRELDRHPLFQVIFALHPTPTAEFECAGLRLEPLVLAGERATVDLEMHLWEEQAGGRVVGYLVYRPQRLSASFGARLTSRFKRLLDAAARHPERCLDEIEILSAGERHQLLVEWNEPRRPPAAASAETFHAVFFARADAHPDTPALRFTAAGQDRDISYGELAARARQGARLLRRRGVGPESRVGLLFDPSPDLIEALLAVLAAGGAFVPLDPGLPRRRLAFQIEDARLQLLLTCSATALPLPARLPAILEWPPELIGEEDSAPLDDLASSAHIAYVIYTSGSTGRPKGAMLTHSGLVNLSRDRTLDTRPEDVFLQFASFSFDAAIYELVMAFTDGAVFDLGDVEERRPAGDELVALLRRRKITQAVLPPSALAADPAIAASLPRLRTLALGGDICTPDLVRAWAPGRTLINAYGPTEATICATSAVLSPSVAGRQPIGRPVHGFELLVLGGDLRPCPLGVPGELFLGGTGLGRGYLGRPALTARSFPPHVGSPRSGARLYRTGDRVRYRDDGQLEFLGRLDHQVKLRGYRIETGEIETLLAEHPDVRRAAVMARRPAVSTDEASKRARLVAWIEPEGQEAGPRVAQEQLESWRTIYEDLYAGPGRGPDDFDVAGWRSSFTGRPIPAEQMREWVDDTLQRIYALTLPPAPAVLEIGCGTGLIAWRLAPRAGDYLATDFAPMVIERLATRLAAAGEDYARVTPRHQEAADFTAIPRRRFDLVVLNSVAQYFPGVEYLLMVVRGAVEAAAPGGTVFLGDLRHLGLHHTFCAAVELAQAADDLPLGELRRRIAARQESEEELLIDPAFFTALPALLPRIRGVRIEPRLGRHRNEMSLYRYDVTLKLDIPFTRATPSSGDPVRWYEDLAVAELEALLKMKGIDMGAGIGLRRLPDPRLRRDRRLLELLESPGDLVTAGELRRALDAAPTDHRGEAPDPAELTAMARRAGLTLSWRVAGFAHNGAHDVVFHPPHIHPTLFEPEPRSWSSYVNHPLRDRLARQLVPRLRRHLEERLPEYMLPAQWVMVDEMPFNVAGKIDRRRLPEPGVGRGQLDASYTAPRNEIEKCLAAIWSGVLGLAKVGVDDDFFELGGHSLLATQVMSRARRELGIEIELGSLFEHPTVAQLAAEIERRREDAPEMFGLPFGDSGDDSEIFEMLTI